MSTDARSIDLELSLRARLMWPLDWLASAFANREAPKVVAEDFVDLLEQLYSFRDHGQVDAFLRAHPSLPRVLVAAYPQVLRHFGADVGAVLAVTSDPESVTAPRELVAFIQVPKDQGSARPQLKAFDENWWLDAMTDTDGSLSFALEYA